MELRRRSEYEAERRWSTFRRAFIKLLNVLVRLTISPTLRIWIYRMMGVKIGKKVYIGMDCFLDDEFPELIEIGSNVTFGARVIVTAHDDAKGVDGTDGTKDPETGSVGKVRIEDGVYVGVGTIILPGVTIGRGSVIGAGSVVTKDIPPENIAFGVPARVYKQINE